MHSIRIKITAITIAGILATMVAFIVVSFNTMGVEAGRSSGETMELMSDNARLTLDSYFDSIEQSVQMASNIAGDTLDGITLVECGANVSADQRTESQTKKLDAYLREHCNEVQEAFASVATRTNGVVTYYYCINPEVSVATHGFFYSKVGKAGFEEREPLDARELDPNDLEHTTWYYTPIERGRPSWVGPYKAHFLGEVQTVSYLIPIYRAGTLIGVLGMDILFETIESIISNIQVYDTGYACLLDDQGLVLYHPDLDMGAVPVLVEQMTQADAFERKGSGSEPIRYHQNGKEWQLSYATLATGMKLVVTAPVKEIAAPWIRLINSILPIALGILALFIPLSLLAVGAVIKPLRRLTEAALQLSAGDYDVELDYASEDEVGMLTNSFRQMRDHLRIYISDLNSKVYVDALTGVKNKGAYDVYAIRINDAIRRRGDGIEASFGLVMLDCNGLKVINDEYGHEKGDRYLRAACQLICDVFDHSPVFRIGGDEFVVLLQGHDFEQREQLLAEFDTKKELINASAQDPWDTVDIAKGMAVFQPEQDTSIEQVLSRADQRMYEDKRKRQEETGRPAR